MQFCGVAFLVCEGLFFCVFFFPFILNYNMIVRSILYLQVYSKQYENVEKKCLSIVDSTASGANPPAHSSVGRQPPHNQSSADHQPHVSPSHPSLTTQAL